MLIFAFDANQKMFKKPTNRSMMSYVVMAVVIHRAGTNWYVSRLDGNFAEQRGAPLSSTMPMHSNVINHYSPLWKAEFGAAAGVMNREVKIFFQSIFPFI